ncbi:MAG: asparagine synthase (glutamine-hydrolyzing) [Eubacteriales bacterium]|nr:asparagine synthase (glutamine-hydrolyzing) [Eubacteriales bacterium]
MCGICGFIGKQEGKEAIVNDMLNAIRHRGPDGQDARIREDAALGFCRLSIIDLEGGMQPMDNEDGEMTLVFNGEVYNYKALRKKLEKAGHTFANHSDSETVLHGFEEYGTGVVDHLRGMFAFAIWDEKNKRLFAARDFFGIKPFYYAMINGCFVFASEIKSILEFPGCPREVNREALEQYLSFQYSILDETFFKGIYRLPAGSFLTYENGRIKVEKYFDPVLTPKKMHGDQKIMDRLEKVLKESVQTHMVSDVEIGAFLSGGVDSSFVAERFTGNKAFTVGFMDKKSKYNEIQVSEELAKKLELEHHTKNIDRNEFWEAVPKVMYYLDEPSGDASAIALYFVSQEAAKYVKVVTSGEGADELFGGYNIYLEPEALKWLSWIPKSVRKKIGNLAEKLPENLKGRNYLIRAAKDVEERFIGNANIFSNEERRQILRVPTDALSTDQLLKQYYDKAANLKDVDKMQYVDLTCWLEGDILLNADRMSMAHSLELRVPYLDKEVFKVAQVMPSNAKTRKNQTKYLFRKVTEKYLPQESASRKKLGFPVPIRVWLKEEPCYLAVKEAFSGDTAREYFRCDEILKLLEEHKKGIRDNSRKIWTVYMFLVWHQVYFEGKSIFNN